jgi:hypothetical protein
LFGLFGSFIPGLGLVTPDPVLVPLLVLIGDSRGEQLWCYRNTLEFFKQRHITGRIAWLHYQRVNTSKEIHEASARRAAVGG